MTETHEMQVRGQVRFTVLGGTVGVVSDGETVALGGPQQRRLLAVLLAEHDAVVLTDRLVETIWPEDEAPDGARRTVMSYVSRLRGSIGGDHLVTRDNGYELVLEDASYDAADFELALAEARASEREAAVDTYDRALALWSGRAFGADADEWWLRPVAARLEELRLLALEERAEQLIDNGRHAQAVADLEQLVAEQPLRERFVDLLMRALYLGGRQAEALREYRRFHDYLGDETGLSPSDALAELEQRIMLGDPSLAPTDSVAVPGYELNEVIGEGAFGAVYRAVQPSVGREVAVKVVRAELADDPRFVQRFEAEAQLVARLEHPHIVPLYDFWRRPGGAFLVFRLLRGGSLAERIADGPLPLPDATRLVDEMSGALSAAHALGVVHRDVKPANVLFDEGGNSYLADFGIAVLADADDELDLRSAGSPMYASPEQARDGTATAASDQYALAVVAWEALAGRAPFSGTSTTQVLQAKFVAAVPSLGESEDDAHTVLDSVLQRATAPHPADRYATVEEFAQAWHEALANAGADATRTTGRLASESGTRTTSSTLAHLPAVGANPYKGLRAFREADTADFHGRADLVERLVGAVDASSFVAVVGPSGSGKSSLVHAGLVPELRHRGALVVSMVPGTDPLVELEAALRRVATAEDEASIGQRLRAPGGLVAVVADLVDAGEQLVLVVDQFEELWTMVDSGTTRDRFAELLVHAAGEQSPLHVVVTLRADLYDRPLQHPGLGPIVSRSTFAVTPMTAAELQIAIVAPAERVGVRFEPGLVATMVGDVVNRPGALPLLQFTLTELFERRAGTTITAREYEALGGVGGALASRAEKLYEQTEPAQRSAVRALFTQLVSPGDDNDDLRRRATTDELAMVAPAVVDRYLVNRLLVSDHHPITREPTIEVAHEALLREWPRLREWIDQDRDAIRVRRLVSQTAAEWNEAGRDESILYRGPRLTAADEVARQISLAAAERDFLAASHVLENREQDAVRERAVAQARQNKRLRRTLVATAIILVIALVLGGLAVNQRDQAAGQRNQARDQRDRARVATAAAQQQLLVSESQAQLVSDRQLATLLAIEADRRKPGADTRDVLLNAVLAEPHLQRSFADSTAEMGALVGHRVVLFRAGPTRPTKPSRDLVQVWDWQTGRRQPWPAAPPGDRTTGPVGLTTTLDGRTLAIVSGDGTIQLYSGDTLEPVGPPLASGLRALGYGCVVSFSSNGGTLAVSGGGLSSAPYAGPSVSVFSKSAGGWVRDPSPGGHRTHVNALDVSADGSVVAAASPVPGGATAASDIVISAVATGRTLLAFQGIATRSIALDWARHRLVASEESAAGKDAEWYDLGVADPAPNVIARGINTQGYANIAYDATRSRLAIFGSDRFGILDAATFDPLPDAPVLRPNANGNTGEFVLLDATHVLLAPVVSGGAAEPVSLWDLTGTSALATRATDATDAGPHAAAAGVGPTGDPDRLVGYSRNTLTVYGPGFRPIGEPIPNVKLASLTNPICIEPRDGRIATVTQSGDVVIRAGTPPFRTLSRAPGVAAKVPAVDWCSWRPDDRQIAFGTYPAGNGLDQTASVVLYDVARRTIRTLSLPPSQLGVFSIAYSADSKTLWAAGPTTATNGVFQITDLDRRPRLTVAFPGGAEVDTDAAHRRLVVASVGSIRVYDSATRRALTPPIDLPGGTIYGVYISPDGGQATVVTAQGWRLVDLDAQQPTGPTFPMAVLGYVTFGSDNTTVYSMSDVYLTWNLAPAHVQAVACDLAGRNLTAQEWQKYLSWAGPRRATCSQYPLN